MSRLIPFAILVALLSSACATASISPPAEPTHETAYTFDGSFDDVWEAAVDWFSESNIPIGQIDRSSGLITSEHRLGADDEMIDCGEVNPGDWILVATERTLNVNLRVRNADPGTRVQLDVFGRGSFSFRNPLNNQVSSIEAARCHSTGALESWVFEYVQESLGG